MKPTARITTAIRRTLLGASALAIGVASTPFVPVSAQATPTPPPDQTGSGPFSPDIPVDSSRIWIVLLIFLTALAIAAIVAYVMRNENRDTRNWVTALLAAGHAVSTDQVAAVLHAEPAVRGAGGDEGDENAPPPPVTVLGPTTVARGAEALYRTVDETGKPITEEDVAWLIVDGSITAADVTLQAPSGPFTVLSTQKLGIFILQVTAGDRTPANIPITIVESVAEPKQSGLKAFFLGDGYGTINLALFLLAIVAALGAIGVVGDGTVSTIFGAMAGYIFGIAVVTHNKGGGSGSDSGG
jgi:hypothetical protein